MSGVRWREEPAWFDRTTNWAKVFWGSNSMTTRCIRQRDLSNGDAAQGFVASDGNLGVHHEAFDDSDGAHLQQLAMDLVSSYVEALETAPARLYDNERQEVHSGLVSRAGREVITALGARDLWCSEHGSHVTRVLVEVRIYLRWMAQQEQSIYAEYQAYGAGKAKLYKRIMNEVVQDLGRPDIDDATTELERLSHNDEVLDFRVVDTRDSFAAGKSIRTMAQECDMLDLDRQSYYMASGVAHCRVVSGAPWPKRDCRQRTLVAPTTVRGPRCRCATTIASLGPPIRLRDLVAVSQMTAVPARRLVAFVSFIAHT